jgi:hypothetical protein
MPTAPFGLAVVPMGGKIYAIGGVRANPFNPSSFERTRTVEVYDPLGCKWSVAPPLLNARAHFAAGVIPNKDKKAVLYVVGGEDGTLVNRIESFMADGFPGGTP